jgi:hypothetical protein
MTHPAVFTKRAARLRLLVAVVCSTALLTACGGDGGSDDGTANAPPSASPSPPPPPPASRCIDTVPAATSSVKFATPVAPAASTVEVSTNGRSACFLGTDEAGVVADSAVTPGSGHFYYFEAKPSQIADIAIGVSVSAATTPPAGGFVPSADTLVLRGTDMITVDSAGATQAVNVGSGGVFGFAVDMRYAQPVVHVIAPASVNAAACGTLAADAPCAVRSWQFATPAASISIYAYGKGDGTNGPRMTLNTGGDLLAAPYIYPTAAVMTALRVQRLYGDREFNAQWPAATGPASMPALTRVGGDTTVVRVNDTPPPRTSFAVTPTNAAGGVVAWTDEAGTARGSGNALTLDAALINALALGDHVLTASVTNPQNGRYGQTTFRLRVVAADDNTDHDGDGLTYDQERTAALDPGNPDTDGDGLSDGAEAGLNKNPLVADNTELPYASYPKRAVLVEEAGATSRGVIVGEDGGSAFFTDQINASCVQGIAPYTDPIYRNSSFGPLERCAKRAVRTNVGIAQGEFRYFETRRLGFVGNLGHGVITRGAQIDPFFCFIDSFSDTDYPLYVNAGPPATPTAANPTPPSLAYNAIGGGPFVRLVFDTSSGFSADTEKTTYYGFAVDYRGSDPVVYLVGRDAGGAMTVSQGVTVSGFNGGEVVPMLYGHPTSNTMPSSAINLGLQRFHYDLAAVRTAIGPSAATALVFGVGSHRW